MAKERKRSHKQSWSVARRSNDWVFLLSPANLMLTIKMVRFDPFIHLQSIECENWSDWFHFDTQLFNTIIERNWTIFRCSHCKWLNRLNFHQLYSLLHSYLIYLANLSSCCVRFGKKRHQSKCMIKKKPFQLKSFLVELFWSGGLCVLNASINAEKSIVSSE